MRRGAVLISVLLVGACANTETPTASAAGRVCFLARDVDSWLRQGDASVLFKTHRNDIWQSRLTAPCEDLDFAQRVVFEDRTGPWICEGDQALIRPRQANHPASRCNLDQFRRLTRNEVAALGADRPF